MGMMTPPNKDRMVRAPEVLIYEPAGKIVFPHTYLDGISSFMSLSLWAAGTIHSTATLPIQRVPSACMGFGSCTVSIFSCPAPATLAGQAFFSSVNHPNPNPISCTCHLRR
jgi:hypothetical protein